MDVNPSDHNIVEHDPNAIARRITWYHKAFQSYNIERVREILRYLPPERVKLFQAVPFLLHINHPDLTGFVNNPGVPFGISRFYHSGFWKLGLKQFGFSQKDMRPFLPEKLWIFGLYLMGSVGTLAQTKNSDFDYWVIVDKAAKDPQKLLLLERKLNGICEWGKSVYNQEISFFILDMDKVRQNDFVAVDAESSGSAQKTLLKEEFYRTFIVVSGQVPYWAVLPPRLSTGQYKHWIKLAGKANLASFDPSDYLDLGPLDRIELSECLGALLWQIYKARSDPAKALIKAALIAHYYFFQDESGLLCDDVKSRFSKPGKMFSSADPYAVVFEKAEAFFDWVQDSEGVELIRICIFFRLISFPYQCSIISGSPKDTLIKRLLKQWNWPENVQKDLMNYENWSIKRLSGFEDEIIQKLSFIFEMVRRHGSDVDLGFNMKPSDLNGLKNRIAATFKARVNKLPRCPLVLQKKMPGDVVLAYSKEPEFEWNLNFAGDDRSLMKAKDLVYMAGWMIYNHLIVENQHHIRFQTSEQTVSAGRIGQVLSRTAVFFKTSSADGQEFQVSPAIDRLLVVLFDQSSLSGHKGATASFLWRNTWGEMFYKQDVLNADESKWSRYYAIARHIRQLKADVHNDNTVYRILDNRSQPDRKVEETVLDMVTSMDQLDSKEDESDSTDEFDSRPILDLF